MSFGGERRHAHGGIDGNRLVELEVAEYFHQREAGAQAYGPTFVEGKFEVGSESQACELSTEFTTARNGGGIGKSIGPRGNRREANQGPAVGIIRIRSIECTKEGRRLKYGAAAGLVGV